MATDAHNAALERLEEHLTVYPYLADRILRQLLVELHARGLVNIDKIYHEARSGPDAAPAGTTNPNEAEAPRGDSAERMRVNDIVKRATASHLTTREIDEFVNLTLKREEADNLRAIASLGSVSFRVLADKVRRFCALPEGEIQLAPDEAMGIRVGLIRHFVSDQLEFIAVAKKYLRVRDFQSLITQIIGPEAGMGRIGGKAAGMFLASKILRATDGQPPSARATQPASPVALQSRPPTAEPAELPIAIPESYYLRSDVIEDFIAFNQLGEYQNQKYKSSEEIRREYPLIKSVFRNAEFPAGIVDQLRQLLNRIGTHPVIVRSSSLLEDRFGTAFSGKYSSIFLANQGSIGERLHALLGAIAEVFASALGPDPLLYRREHDLTDYAEDMAVLIQKVVGHRVGDYLTPVFAGVAFSRNEIRWSPRIKREDGLVRIVMGLGTRAVDRIGTESARMVALGMPTLRHESSVGEIMRRSQRTMDVINIRTNRFESVPVERLLQHAADFPLLDRVISLRRDGMLVPPPGTYIDASPDQMYVTFDKLLTEGTFPAQMRSMLQRLEQAYGSPVDVEFAHDGQQLYLLQCRTQAQAQEIAHVNIPTGIPDEKTIFSARRFVRTGLVENIEYIVYIDSREYDGLSTREERIAVARLVGKLNDRLTGRVFILIGPGRWGSNDVRLGVPVSYADINKTRMLIEVARERDGYVLEVSYGTHFFQDLIEANIAYLPLYPDDRRNRFNEAFLAGSPNALPELVPNAEALASVVRVVHIPAVADGRLMRVVMDSRVDEALAYLVEPA